MKSSLLPSIFAIGLILTLGCRSQFEKVRTSNDPELMLTAADSLFANEDYGRAITLYELIVPSFRGKREAEHIAYRIASGHYYDNSFILSSHYFKQFSDTYVTSEFKEEALYLNALSHYRLSPRYQLDQTDSEAAIDAFQAYANAYPNSDKVEECNRYIDELRSKNELKEYNAGKLYYNRGDYSSAIQSLENLLKDFPDTDYAEDARYVIVKASVDWANRSIYTKKEERYRKTVEKCDSYLKRHSAGDKAEEIVSIKDKSNEELKTFQNG